MAKGLVGSPQLECLHMYLHYFVVLYIINAAAKKADPDLVAFPFQFHVDETTLNNAARELTELGGQSLGMVG